MPDTVQEVLQAFARGELVVVTDDEDREGEGDLIVAASLCTAEKMSFISSLMTPTGGRPESLQRSTAASVWPERSSTPPSLAISGKMWPGRAKSLAPTLGLDSARQQEARSSAEMPVPPSGL